MRVPGIKARAAAGVTGAALFASLAAVRAVSSATATSVSFAGNELHWGCSFRQLFGVPCPACGMTRSVVLTLHGALARAVELNPGGPFLILGVILLGILLLLFTLRPDAPLATDARTNLLRRLVLGSSAYGMLTTAVVLAHWFREIL